MGTSFSATQLRKVLAGLLRVFATDYECYTWKLDFGMIANVIILDTRTIILSGVDKIKCYYFLMV